jgi:hypothetical protein
MTKVQMKYAVMGLAVGVATAMAGTAVAGMRYESLTRTVNDKGKESQEFMVTSWVDGDRARIEFREAKGAPLPDGAYLITTDGGTHMIMVNPKEKQYMEWNLDAMLQTLGELQQASGGMVKIDFKDTSAVYGGSSPGEEILGYPTTKHTMTTGYTLEMKVMGMTQKMTVKAETESWVTDKLTAPGFGAWLRKTPPKTGDPDLDKLFTGLAGKIDGVVLRSVTNSVTTDKKGRQKKATSTTQVQSIEETDTPDTMFAVPEGFEKIEMPSLAGGEGGDGEQPAGMGDLFKKAFGG